ncbi:MAG: 23S rRNA (guanosine(2251)-2'-O)-methyltransferase RlmB [Acidobacteriota bacterium]
MLIYGIHAVAEAVRAGRARSIRVADRHDGRVRTVLEEAARRGVAIERVARAALDRSAQGAAHQGLLAVVEDRAQATLDELMTTREGAPLIVVLDGVEDPHNVGAILRTVDAAGGSGVVRQTRRAAPLSGAVAKASAGAVSHVAVADVVNIARALEELKRLGVWIVGLDEEAERQYDALDLTMPVALVVGAEGRGLRRLVRDRCDYLVSIPMVGQVSSLNVSAAAAVVMFEAVRQRRSRGRQG